jgi:hypothetical protein
MSSAPPKNPSAIYRLIWQAMHGRQNIAFEYNGRPREGSPIILGYSDTGRETLKLYQTGGRTSQGRLPDWRDFYIDQIRMLTMKAGDWREGTSHKHPQAFVKFIDVDINIPDTLVRDEPLAFGSTELRRPRGKK